MPDVRRYLRTGEGLERWLENVVLAVRERVTECTAKGKSVVLLGWGLGALLACQVHCNTAGAYNIY